jgi:hypothetical protein
MPASRVRSLRVALISCAALSWGGPASAADHRHKFQDGTLIVSVDSTWNEVKDFPEDVIDAVGFRVGDGSLMQWLLQPGSGAPAGSGAGGNLRIMAMQLKRMLEEKTSDISDALLPIGGSGVTGYYVRAVDPDPGPDEWKYMYTGYVAVNDVPIMFNIVWNQGGQAAADRALAAVKTLRLTKN